MSKKQKFYLLLGAVVLLGIGGFIWAKIDDLLSSADSYETSIVKDIGFSLQNSADPNSPKNFVQDGEMVTYEIKYDLTKAWPPGKGVGHWRILGEIGIRDMNLFTKDPADPKARHQLNLYLGKIDRKTSDEAVVELDASKVANAGTGKTININKQIAKKPKGTIKYTVKINGQNQAVVNTHGVLTYKTYKKSSFGRKKWRRFVAAVAGDVDGVNARTIDNPNGADAKTVVNTLWAPIEPTTQQSLEPGNATGCQSGGKVVNKFVSRSGMVYNPDTKSLIRFGKNMVDVDAVANCSKLPFYVTDTLRIKTGADGKVTFETAPMRGYEKGQPAGTNLPKVNEDPIMAYDPVGKTVILFADDGKTWRYDDRNDQWSIVNSPTGPSPRVGAKMVTVIDKIYMFGGKQNKTMLNDMWIFDGKTNMWTEEKTEGTPSGRAHFAMAFYDGVIFMFGGYTGPDYKNPTNEFWSYESHSSSKKWFKSQSKILPSARGFATLTLHPEAKALLLTGGVNKKGRLVYDSNYLYPFHYNGEWQNLDSVASLYSAPTDPRKSVKYKVKQTLPVPPVAAGSAAYLPDQNMIVVLGNTDKLNPKTLAAKGYPLVDNPMQLVIGLAGSGFIGGVLGGPAWAAIAALAPPVNIIGALVVNMALNPLFQALGLFQKKIPEYSFPFGAQLWGYSFARQEVAPNSPLPAADNPAMESATQNYTNDPQVQAGIGATQQNIEQANTQGITEPTADEPESESEE